MLREKTQYLCKRFKITTKKTMKKTVAIFIILILFPFYNMYGKQKINFSFLGGLDTYDNWCMTPSFDYFPKKKNTSEIHLSIHYTLNNNF